MATKQITDPFVLGLKAYISEKDITQKEFAKGVTSRVNLSNVLRGKTGVSPQMRKKLAKKTGMSMNDLITWGKQAVLTPPKQETPAIEEELEEEVLNQVHEFSQRFTSEVSSAVSTLLEERNTLTTLLRQERQVLDTLPDWVKTVDRDLRITYCNRAVTQTTQQVAGDRSCTEKGIEARILRKVFATGKVERTLVGKEGQLKGCTFYPVTTAAGYVTEILIHIQLLQPWQDLLIERGLLGMTPKNAMQD